MTKDLKQLPDFKNFTQDLLREDNILLGISELSFATGIPANQLRYWHEKGYIRSVPSMKLKFRFDTVILARGINSFKKNGYTLSAAAKKAKEYVTVARKIKSMINDRLVNVETNQDVIELDFGRIELQASNHLIVIIKDNQSSLVLREKS